MKKLLILLLLTLPTVSFAQNIGQCGWGSKIFDGQRGIAPQALAATTNINQTSAITSGTSGCTQDGVVRSSWKTAAFIDSNMNKLARDISRGEGESLESLASLVGVNEKDNALFAKTLQENFDDIFISQNSDSNAVYSSIKSILASNKSLVEYSANL